MQLKPRILVIEDSQLDTYYDQLLTYPAFQLLIPVPVTSETFGQ